MNPDRFAPLVAVELSDPTAGHRVVLYPDEGKRITTSKIEEIWPALDGTGAVVVPHHINVTSEGGWQNWQVQDWQPTQFGVSKPYWKSPKTGARSRRM